MNFKCNFKVKSTPAKIQKRAFCMGGVQKIQLAHIREKQFKKLPWKLQEGFAKRPEIGFHKTFDGISEKNALMRGRSRKNGCGQWGNWVGSLLDNAKTQKQSALNMPCSYQRRDGRF